MWATGPTYGHPTLVFLELTCHHITLFPKPGPQVFATHSSTKSFFQKDYLHTEMLGFPEMIYTYFFCYLPHSTGI